MFIVVVRRYSFVSDKMEHKYSLKTLISVICSVRIYAKSYDSGVHTSYGIYKNMVGTLTDLSNIILSSEPVSFSLVNTIRINYL